MGLVGHMVPSVVMAEGSFDSVEYCAIACHSDLVSNVLVAVNAYVATAGILIQVPTTFS